MPPDIVHPPANLESLVASDQRNNDGKEGSLGDPDEQVPDSDGFFKARNKLRKADVQLTRGDQHPPEDSQHIRVHRQQRQRDDQRQRPWKHEQRHRRDAQRPHGIQLFRHFHGPDLGRIGRSRPAGNQDGHKQW